MRNEQTLVSFSPGFAGKSRALLAVVYVCVCVNPWTKGSPLLTFSFFPPVFHPERNFHQQGATESLHGCRQRSSMQLTRISRLITVTYLPQQPLTTLSNLPGLFPWSFMLPPRNRFPSADLQQLSRRFECH